MAAIVNFQSRSGEFETLTPEIREVKDRKFILIGHGKLKDKPEEGNIKVWAHITFALNGSGKGTHHYDLIDESGKSFDAADLQPTHRYATSKGQTRLMEVLFPVIPIWAFSKNAKEATNQLLRVMREVQRAGNHKVPFHFNTLLSQGLEKEMKVSSENHSIQTSENYSAEPKRRTLQIDYRQDMSSRSSDTGFTERPVRMKQLLSGIINQPYDQEISDARDSITEVIPDSDSVSNYAPTSVTGTEDGSDDMSETMNEEHLTSSKRPSCFENTGTKPKALVQHGFGELEEMIKVVDERLAKIRFIEEKSKWLYSKYKAHEDVVMEFQSECKDLEEVFQQYLEGNRRDLVAQINILLASEHNH